MNNVCCKEFKGWCKSFTRTELLLSVLQAVFLIAFIVLLTFLILHFVACFKSRNKHGPPLTEPKDTSTGYFLTTDNFDILQNTNESLQDYEINNVSIRHSTTDLKEKGIEQHTTIKHIKVVGVHKVSSTLDKGITCTWQPSKKTEAPIHYHEDGRTSETMSSVKINTTIEKIIQEGSEDNKLIENIPDGEIADDVEKHFVVALVKIKPPQDVTFGCMLTVISGYWALTAASCIEAIEEVHSLDSFVMMQGFNERNLGTLHPIADVMIHPQYQGVNATYDLAALKSENNLAKNGISPVTLPSMLDYFQVTVGESLTMLGYGRFRSMDKDPLSRTVRRVSVHSVPSARCPRVDGTWAPRHLSGGQRVPPAACGSRPLCAAPLRRAPAPCNYCAGTPLLHGRVLLAVMSDNQHCGLACDPVLFVNLALVRDWIDSLLSN